MNKVAFLPPWRGFTSCEPSGKNNREKKGEREKVNSKRLENKQKNQKRRKRKEKKCYIEQREFAFKFVLIKIYFHGSYLLFFYMLQMKNFHRSLYEHSRISVPGFCKSKMCCFA